MAFSSFPHAHGAHKVEKRKAARGDGTGSWEAGRGGVLGQPRLQKSSFAGVTAWHTIGTDSCARVLSSE